MALYEYDKDSGDLKLLAGRTLYADAPVGTIQAFGGANVPAGYLLCNGAEVLKATYAELYAVIGDAFGTASDNTKFVLPDLRGEFLRGAGTNSHSGQGNGGAVGEHQDGSIHRPIGSHYDPNTGKGGISLYTAGIEKWASSANDFSGDSPTGSSTGIVAPTNLDAVGSGYTGKTTEYRSRPTNTSVNYIIKAKQVALPADLETQVEEAVSEMGVHFEEQVSGIGAGQTTKSYTITKAGYYFIYAHGNPYANNVNFVIELDKGDNLITKGSSNVTGFDHISVEHVVYCSVGDVIYAKFTNLTTDNGWNSWGLFRITT